MGTFWISRKGRILEKGIDLEKRGMTPFTNYGLWGTVILPTTNNQQIKPPNFDKISVYRVTLIEQNPETLCAGF